MNNLLTKVSTDLPLSLMLRLTPCIHRCWDRRHGRTEIHGWLLIALFSLLVSCSSTPPIAFQNNSHRQIYALNEENLKKVQFYISRDVVAQYQDATGTKSLLVPRLTPGVVTSAGPDWLKVSFKEGGADVPFITDPNQYDGRYWIASEVEGGKDFKKVSELPVKSFYIREPVTRWFPEAMPSCSSTGTAGRKSWRLAKLPRGGGSKTSNFGENSGVMQDGAVKRMLSPFLLARPKRNPQGIRQPTTSLGKLSKTSKAPRIALWRDKRATGKQPEKVGGVNRCGQYSAQSSMRC